MAKVENPPAFPSQPNGIDGLPVDELSEGMTMRDWFAGQALAGFCSLSDEEAMGASDTAKAAYNYADAMLTARENSHGE